MTEDHQNTDCYHVTAMSTANRVPGTRLSTETPQSGLLEMENGNCLPTALDNAKQGDNCVKVCGENHSQQHSVSWISGQ